MKKRVALYGSTGSIGRQTLDVVRAYPEKLRVEVLVAGNNYKLLIKQAKEFVPHVVVITNTIHYPTVSGALKALPIKVFTGKESLVEVAKMDVYDIMLAAIVGFSGMESTLAAASQGKVIALANKESLVVAGELIMKEAKKRKSLIIPIDSEHSAIFQCMHSGKHKEIARVILTASGGALRDFSKVQISKVKAAEALEHPTWNSMGQKVTIDSASLMNKGLEMIEAKWVFNLRPEQIDAVIHPQSIIHSMVEFVDGNILSQMSKPDMRLPIAYALLFPSRLASSWSNYNPIQKHELSFYPIDGDRFPNIELAKEAMKCGGSMACVLNAANEVAVAAFLQEKLSFYGMSELVEKCMSQMPSIGSPTLSDYLECDKETRSFAAHALDVY